MIESQRRLRWFGGLGLAVGLVIVLGAPLGGGEFAGMLRGYGMMLTSAAIYLLAGQWLLCVIRERRVSTRGARTATEQHQRGVTPQV